MSLELTRLTRAVTPSTVAASTNVATLPADQKRKARP
jgi:hypothetical protein